MTDVAFRLAVRCGLRSEEVIGVAPNDVVDTDAGMMLRIWNGAKTGEHRETPIPEALANTITTIADVRDEPDDYQETLRPGDGPGADATPSTAVHRPPGDRP
ncbi:hypothetical protein [Halapricum hydrolyticum]|uniref:Uncharacterized protein n=1 Tax=Halapricum hydrolyticum TaxID=2979991 RepID=A0AAE3I9C3_9EURY|nr:hypothetical protein [Halapricum hydrolyticum]MCU4725409.1 hypothetical protein [Halapricum hydrolyticum]